MCIRDSYKIADKSWRAWTIPGYDANAIGGGPGTCPGWVYRLTK